ncbi:MAG: galactokinase family protein [Coriobacteriia bacterium]|nr:galactokinase family protein [Coriobacteriia bacterium]
MKLKAFAPGRTEIAGNHVDHQHGIAVTGSLKQGISADVELRDDYIIRIESEGFEPFEVDLIELKSEPIPNTEHHFTSKALVAGVSYSFMKQDIPINGFTAKMTSTIGSGMGLSSSAAFELLIGVILNEAYNDGKMSKMELAQIGQFAEVEFYGKPCGLLDQTAISYGGIIAIDFKNPQVLDVSPIDFSFDKNGLGAVLVDSGAEHGDISHMYAAIPEDMKTIASKCNVDFLNDTSIEELNKQLFNVSNKSALRGIHYFHEINLVEQRIKALQNNDIKTFMYLHGLSGSSSTQFLQNVTVSEENQQATLCQAICELALDISCKGNYSNRGASRIHGGGFGGCIQVFLPKQQVECFMKLVNTVYNKNAAQEIEFSESGAYAQFL